jgi:MFS-type transporter involved in bile tolerance (Atg22 family)
MGTRITIIGATIIGIFTALAIGLLAYYLLWTRVGILGVILAIIINGTGALVRFIYRTGRDTLAFLPNEHQPITDTDRA